jgi:hypothetical protein
VAEDVARVAKLRKLSNSIVVLPAIHEHKRRKKLLEKKQDSEHERGT